MTTAKPLFRLGDDGHYYVGRFRVAQDSERHAKFYLEHGPIRIPHRHARLPVGVSALSLSCDACGKEVPPEELHGTINDHARCIEVRVVSACPDCTAGPARILHNVLRFDGSGEMTYQQDGQWLRTTSWWKWIRHRLGF